ncbi:aromatic ring-hydroxylating dioxygenase subunit alpha [Flavobacterium galactosidilyticum]|uniref:aromatic ring-hydroxylating oxygenase subunit alpha n=1 Tax=Flavobacterium galactosidilyticum TaxID=2893886 RepID=UPI001E57F08C|nr:aromatic ring-hydroxylating dioxygenase subunit alpha [Flavobacterium sp. F-340]UFH46669.1 aromatic ring-hydroxylating dioxygenase subunit alpha [Flavobacterium sp. F-340]
MIQKLTPFHYTNKEYFETEIKDVFEANWQFACMKSELSERFSYFVVEYNQNSYFVTNTGKDGIRAFKNVCSHRANKIFINDFGKRPIMCLYHNWTYNSEGKPINAFAKEFFETPEESDLLLDQYEVQIVGDFVFVNIGKSAKTIEDQLGIFYNKLIDISEGLGKKITYTCNLHQCNWKLLSENVLECYHCLPVHKNSLVERLGIGLKPFVNFDFFNGNSSGHLPVEKNETSLKRKKILKYLDNREFKHDTYYHLFIYPNLFISSTEGISFYIGHALPNSFCETNLRTRYFECKINNMEDYRNYQDVVNVDIVNFGNEILNEDKEIIQNVQKGLTMSNKSLYLNKEEFRIKEFHEHYCSQINTYDF